MENNTEQNIKGGLLLDMFIHIRDLEIQNARTGKYSDETMAKDIATYIYNRVKNSTEKE